MRSFAKILRIAALATALAATAVSQTGTGTLKPSCMGLMTRGGLPPAGITFMDSIVIQVNWSDLESAAGTFTGSGWATIDAARGKGYKIRVRILAGVQAPKWLKQMGHAPVSGPDHNIDWSQSGGIAIWNPQDEAGGCSDFFWIPAVENQYDSLMQEVARRYEGASDIVEVVDSACMTTYAEPLYRAHGDVGTNTRLFQAGFNYNEDLACQQTSIQIHQKYFHTTRTSFAVNAWDVIDSQGNYSSFFSQTYAFAQWARGQMGQSLTFQNNGLRPDSSCSGTPQSNTFCYLQSIAPPKGFQTATLDRLGGTLSGLLQTLDNALTFGAQFVEMPSGFQQFDAATLQQYNAKFEASKPNSRGLRPKRP